MSAMHRPELPTGHIGIHELIGVKPVTREQAAQNAMRRRHPMRPRPGRVGLIDMGAPALWALVDSGDFPAPVVGPFGNAWPLEAVLRWRDAQPK
ncbi:hypothetical protein [Rhizobacter fulvus]